MLFFDKISRQTEVCYTVHPAFTTWHHLNLSIALQPSYSLEDKGKAELSSFTTTHTISSNKDSVSFWSLIYRCYRADCVSVSKETGSIYILEASLEEKKCYQKYSQHNLCYE